METTINVEMHKAWMHDLDQMSKFSPFFFDESMRGVKSPHLIICYHIYLVAFCSYLAEWAFFFCSWVKLLRAPMSDLSVPPSGLSWGGSHMWERWSSQRSISMIRLRDETASQCHELASARLQWWTDPWGTRYAMLGSPGAQHGLCSLVL